MADGGRERVLKVSGLEDGGQEHSWKPVVLLKTFGRGSGRRVRYGVWGVLGDDVEGTESASARTGRRPRDGTRRRTARPSRSSACDAHRPVAT